MRFVIKDADGSLLGVLKGAALPKEPVSRVGGPFGAGNRVMAAALASDLEWLRTVGESRTVNDFVSALRHVTERYESEALALRDEESVSADQARWVVRQQIEQVAERAFHTPGSAGLFLSRRWHFAAALVPAICGLAWWLVPGADRFAPLSVAVLVVWTAWSWRVLRKVRELRSIFDLATDRGVA